MAIVAMMDVLGFRKMMDVVPLAQLVDLFDVKFDARLAMATAKAVPEPIGKKGTDLVFDQQAVLSAQRICNSLRFSDTIVLYTTEDGRNALLDIVQAALDSIAYFLPQGIALRGAISAGELFVSKTAPLFLGKSIVRAYDLATCQKWAGVVIDEESLGPETLELVEELIGDGILCREDVPLGKGESKRWLCLDWTFDSYSPDKVREWMAKLAPPTDEGSKAKIESTAAFAEKRITARKASK